MCFKTPKPPTTRAAPTATTVSKNTLVVDAKRAAAAQQGAFANIMTSPLGDSNYGAATRKVATFGGGASA